MRLQVLTVWPCEGLEALSSHCWPPVGAFLKPPALRVVVDWLGHRTGVWNWAIRKIEQEAKDGIYSSQKAFHNLLADHGKKHGMPSHPVQGLLDTAYIAWPRCSKKLAKPPRLKGHRNKLTSMPWPDPCKAPARPRLHVPGIGYVRFHAQELPAGRVTSGRIVKRAAGWDLCLFIDAPSQDSPPVADGEIGIAPGFSHLLTCSTGEQIPHPPERRQTAHRLAPAQRGGRKPLTARLQERLVNQRQDRNPTLSRRLVAEHQTIAWSTDAHSGSATSCGQSVASAAHA